MVIGRGFQLDLLSAAEELLLPRREGQCVVTAHSDVGFVLRVVERFGS